MIKVGGKQKPYEMWQAGISLGASPLAKSLTGEWRLRRHSPAHESRQLRRLQLVPILRRLDICRTASWVNITICLSPAISPTHADGYMQLIPLYNLPLFNVYRNANDCASRVMQLYDSQPILCTSQMEPPPFGSRGRVAGI